MNSLIFHTLLIFIILSFSTGQQANDISHLVVKDDPLLWPPVNEISNNESYDLAREINYCMDCNKPLFSEEDQIIPDGNITSSYNFEQQENAVRTAKLSANCDCGYGSCSSVENKCLRVVGYEVCYSTSVQCNIANLCEQTICKVVGWSCSAIAEVVGSTFATIRDELKSRNDSPVPLSTWQKQALKCHFPSLNLDAVKIYYGSSFLNDFYFGDKNYRVGFAVDAQTFMYDIFIRNVRQTTLDGMRKELKTIAHELHHTRQYIDRGSVNNFGYSYINAMCNVGWSYDYNPFEIAADQIESDFGSCSTNEGEYFCLRDYGGNYLSAEWSDQLNRYIFRPSLYCDSSSTFRFVGTNCIAHGTYNGAYLGRRSDNDLTLITQCDYWDIVENNAGQSCLRDTSSATMITYRTSDNRYIMSKTSCNGWIKNSATHKPTTQSKGTQSYGLVGDTNTDNSWNWCSLTNCANGNSGSSAFNPNAFQSPDGPDGPNNPINPPINPPDINNANNINSINYLYFICLIIFVLINELFFLN